MANLDLQGYTLGEKHKHYNTIVKNILRQDSVQHLSQVNYNDSDLDNILKIDVACYERNVSYILEVFKCEDMLYVKRALKKSVWLITDEQYANIVNPKFLHSQLFPYMSSKAINKFSLYIRLNLKNESRVEEFFNYYKDTNLNIAFKWLPNCSIEVIKNATASYTQMINVGILKRLCRKSINILQISVEKQTSGNKLQVMEATRFLMKNHLNEYLNIIQSLHNREHPTLGAKFTRIIMKKSPQTILDNFDKFAYTIHLRTFVKFIKPNNIAAFLLQHHRNEKLLHWFCEGNLKPFILSIPQESRTEFVKQYLIDQNIDQDDSDENKKSCFTNLLAHEKKYYWYKYVPFETAFEDIKKLIQRESSLNERNSMFKVLLYAAGHNMQQIEILLQHYRNKHINEPIKLKSNFVSAVIEQFKAIIFNNSTWKILNELFISMEVYSESTNYVPFCITVAIIHKILYNELVPEILEKKFTFATLKLYRKNLSQEEKEKLFNYLYKYVMKQIKELNIVNEQDFKNGLGLFKNVLMLLSDWEKDLVDFPLVLNEINKFINIKKVHFRNIDISCLYNVNKSWRKHLFHVSIDLWLSEDSCLNALKHNPKLLMSSRDILKSVYCNETCSFKQLINKIRIYWPTIAQENISISLDDIESKSNNKALIRHIIYLLPQKSLYDFIKKYVPEDEKINWNNYEEALLNTRKFIAKCMHTARPQPSLEVVSWYAKGDYLQYVVPSLTATLNNMSSTAFKQEIKVLIKSPVSLRKYCIRVANDKLSNEEIIEMFSNAWKVTKNKSIRADIFKCSFKLLCNEKHESAVKNIWLLLERFIDNLTDEENTEIYRTLAEVNQVPLCVRAHFWKKSYQFLNSLATKSEYSVIINRVIHSSAKFMDIVDVDLITEILRENFKRNLMDKSTKYIELICSCLLSTDNKKSQDDRYSKLFHPVMEQCISSWNVKRGDDYLLRWKLCQLLKTLCDRFYDIVIKNRRIIPDTTFCEIHSYLKQKLPAEENYIILRTWKFSYSFVKILGADKRSICTSYESGVFNTDCGFNDYLISEVIPQFGVELLQFLKEDIKLYYPSIYTSFTKALELMWQFFDFGNLLQMHILKSILNYDVNESYLVALTSIPKYVYVEHLSFRDEVMEIIRSHPSPEVKMHYYNSCSEHLYSRFIF